MELGTVGAALGAAIAVIGAALGIGKIGSAAVPGIYSRKNLSGSSFIYPYTKRSPAAGRLHAEHRRQLLLTANAGDRDHHIQTPGF